MSHHPVSKQAGLSQSKVTEGGQQESLEAAQRADVHDPDKLAAAGHTNTGQTMGEQFEAIKQDAGPEVRAEAESLEEQTRGDILGGGNAQT